MSKRFTADEVAHHNRADDCWIIIHNKVYDVTNFLSEHPGGRKVLLNVAGKDASSQFDNFHKPDVLERYKHLCIGVIGVAPKAASQKRNMPKNTFGELVPYGDPNWYQGFNSPYYTESHKRFRAAMREFVEREITPNCHEWDESRKIPGDLQRKCAEAGFFAGVLGFWPTEFVGKNIAGGVKPEEWDAFHELILLDELSRCASGGAIWGIIEGLAIGLPPLLHFGSPALKQKVAGPCMRGEKKICLCITEPYAGSDVAGIRTEAKKSPCGKYYIVNGEKKWITTGVYADYFTVAVRTGGAGMGGISMLLLDRSMPGITTKPMKCGGVWASGTTYITFEDVKVPVENLIGKENEGFKYVMYNFNHERWGIIVQCLRFARVCYEESFRYAHKRRTFGKPLIENPIIRAKLGNMLRLTEAGWAMLEQLTYQLTKMSHEEQMTKLGGAIALLKVQATQLFDMCTREAVQIFGGLGYTRGGQGEKIERLYRDVRAYAIGGGSEEIMLDLSMRQALKSYEATRSKL